MNQMGTFSPLRTRHKFYQSTVRIEASTRSSELGGSASFFIIVFIKWGCVGSGAGGCLKDWLESSQSYRER